MQDVKLFHEALNSATSEEEVKSLFVKHANFPAKFEDNIDLSFGATLMEFKKNKSFLSDANYYKVLAQACTYAQRLMVKSPDRVPQALCLVCNTEAYIVPLSKVEHTLKDKENIIDWNRAASNPDPILVQELYDLDPEAVYFHFGDAEALKRFVDFVTEGPASLGFKPVKVLITRENYRQVFKQWCEVLYPKLDMPDKEKNKALLFFFDMLDETSLDANKDLIWFKDLGSDAEGHVDSKTYQNFWMHYERPPNAEEQLAIFDSAHMLISKDQRAFFGSFYTPAPLVKRAFEHLGKHLGENWQDEHYVWDPGAGAGNLEILMDKTDKLFLSTLEPKDVLLMKTRPELAGANIFQFDFLNNGFDQLPVELQEILQDEEKQKKLLILMNPPYGEHTDSPRALGTSKTGMNHTEVRKAMKDCGLGLAAMQLTNQFVWASLQFAPAATIATFSLVNFFTFERGTKLRDELFNTHTFAGGFIYHSQNFDGISADFPISFSVFLCRKKTTNKGAPLEVNFDVFDGSVPSLKRVSLSKKENMINNWYTKPRNTVDCIPLQNTHKVPTNQSVRLAKLAPNALGYATYTGSDFNQHRNLAFLLSSAYYGGHGTSVAANNFEKTIIALASRHIPQQTWLNHHDLLLRPTCDRDFSEAAPTNCPRAFVTDVILWFLFHNQNKTSSGELSYNNETMHIENEFFPFSTSDVVEWEKKDRGIQVQANRWCKRNGDRDETFVCRWIKLNEDASTPFGEAILEKASEIYELFYEVAFEKRYEVKLETWNPGWYLVREVCSKDVRGEKLLKELYELRAEHRPKLEEMMFELGMLSK